MAKFTVSDECWLWHGAQHNGYGQVRWNGVTRRAHRVIYEILVGPVPEGLELDHLCRVRNCVRPDHLEPVTHAENMRRSPPGRRGLANAAKTHCPRGHAYDQANTRVSGGSRNCRACDREKKRRESALLPTL